MVKLTPAEQLLAVLDSMPEPDEAAITDAQLIKELRDALGANLEYIDAIPKDVQLPAMPGFDRDWVDGLLGKTPVREGQKVK